MRKTLNQIYLLVIIAILWSCGKEKNDPQSQLPNYLRIPSTLAGYAGSGQVKLSGDLSLSAEGPEQLDASTNTYSGVLGDLSPATGVIAQFTVGQPLSYKQTSTVPPQYWSSGVLSVINTTEPGTYPMGIDSQPTSIGTIADLTINLPGPQLYFTRRGSLTITDKTLIQQQDGNRLYRVIGTFTAVLNATGVGTIPAKAINTTGTFDLLLLSK